MTDSTLYHRLFDLGLEPALVVDPLSDRIVAVNAECCRFLKQSRAWLLQGRLTTLFPDQVPALVVFTESVLAKGRDRTRTLRIDNTDTGPGRLEIGGVRMDRDDRQFLVLTLYDLDERDRMRRRKPICAAGSTPGTEPRLCSARSSKRII